MRDHDRDDRGFACPLIQGVGSRSAEPLAPRGRGAWFRLIASAEFRLTTEQMGIPRGKCQDRGDLSLGGSKSSIARITFAKRSTSASFFSKYSE